MFDIIFFIALLLAPSEPRLSPSPICSDCRAPITPPGGRLPTTGLSTL